MRACRIVAFVLLTAWPTAVLAAEPPGLARARALYNEGSYEEAIASASPVRGQPQFGDAASLVVARSYLERHRQTSNPDDLAAAREALGTVRAAALSPRDRVDLLIGLGQTLYADQRFGAAAQLFDTALSAGAASLLPPGDRARLLDWWASALEREAQTRAADRQSALFAQIATRMTEELETAPGSPVANYWLVASARGEGDLERAWDAAIAGWVRSRLAPDTGEKLQADLDRLVTEALIPERVRTRPTREQKDVTAALASEWEAVKQDWK